MFHLYGLFIGLAIVVGWSLSERMEPKISKSVPWILVGSLVGARLYHVVDLWEYYSLNISQIVMVQEGGLGIWGAIIGGYATLEIINLKFSNSQIEKWKILAVIATVLPLSQAIGRLGNGVNGEFVNKVWFLPWWSVEAILNFFLFIVLWELYLRGSSSQERVGAYLIGYGVIRFMLEFWREDCWMIGGIGAAQWVSLASVVVGLWIWRSSAHD